MDVSCLLGRDICVYTFAKLAAYSHETRADLLCVAHVHAYMIWNNTVCLMRLLAAAVSVVIFFLALQEKLLPWKDEFLHQLKLLG